MHLLSLLGCTLLGGTGPQPINEPDGEFFDAPWPSETRVTDRGSPDLTGFPGVEDIPMIEAYAQVIEDELDGTSTNGPVYFRFDGPLDLDLLPSPEESLDVSSATLFLINIDPSSPDFGLPVPVQVDFQEKATTYQPENLLAFGPISGAPLRPATRYAAVVTTDIARADTALQEELLSTHPNYGRWSDLDAALFELGRSSADIAIATTFTTQDPLVEMATIARHLEDRLGAQSLNQSLEEKTSSTFNRVYEGQVYVPLWQHGERPYASVGGAFQFDEQGEPLMASWERVRMSVSVPKDDPPANGWPVIIYVHGTGGDWTSCCDAGISRRAAQRGMMVIGISQPLHGDRGTENTDVELHSFNLFNPSSARANFRQGALDSVYLAHILTGRAHTFETDGGSVTTDPEHVLYMGHSQGGVTGSMALPFMGDELDAAVLSGAGGLLSLSVLYRKQGGLDLEELVTELLGFAADEQFDAMHPIAALLQTLADATDPINYAPYWHQRRTWFSEAPIDVLMYQGTADNYTPVETSDALSAAAGIPLVYGGEPPMAHQVLGMEPIYPPVERTQPAWGEQSVSTGLASYVDGSHFVAFESDEAQDLYRDFLCSAVYDNPTIGLPAIPECH
jgi:hypothetical protein